MRYKSQENAVFIAIHPTTYRGGGFLAHGVLKKLEHDGKYITYMVPMDHFRNFLYVRTNKQGNHIYNMSIHKANYKIALREIARGLNASNPKQGYYKAIMDAYKNFKANTTDIIEEIDN